MAYTAVVTTAFTDRMINVLRQLERDRGRLTLAVMTPFELLGEERWSLYLAAEWLDELSLRDGIESMRNYFRSRLGHEAARFQQAFILRTSDSKVFTFEKKLTVAQLGTAYRVIGLDLSDFENDDAILFLSRRMQQPKPHQLQAVIA